jgi:hypothetical protein
MIQSYTIKNKRTLMEAFRFKEDKMEKQKIVRFFRAIAFVAVAAFLCTICKLQGDIETLPENSRLPLSTPTEVWTISLKPENQVKLLWYPVSGAESYVVEITSSAGFSSTQTRQVTGITTTYYTDTQTYSNVGPEAEYRIKAVSSTREDSAWSEQVIGIRLAAPSPYDVGDIGPSGGVIVYDKTYISDGWQYLEAAPAYTERTAAWGLNSYSQNFNASWDIGAGMQNTLFINQRLEQAGETGKATQVASNLNVNGCNDWFLPSRLEFEEMLKMRHLLSLNVDRYWSSSTGWLTGTSPTELNRTWFYHTGDNSWYVTDFESGNIERSGQLAVCAMRRF